MELSVLNIKGTETGRTVTLNEQIFGIEPNDHAIYLDVKQYLANQRQGTHKSKERGEIAGSTKKSKSKREQVQLVQALLLLLFLLAEVRVFGPRPRNYGFKLNKKVKQLARKSALTYKALDNDIFVVENFELTAPKTKELLVIANNLKINDRKSIFVLPEENKNLYLSSRNLQGVLVVTASELTTYQILNAKSLVILEGSIEKIEEVFKI
jgi:large subunit ribosomal protein L4